jgi:hypothetical protein
VPRVESGEIAGSEEIAGSGEIAGIERAEEAEEADETAATAATAGRETMPRSRSWRMNPPPR